MKVLITDNRSTPRIIYIDGIGYILPSKHPVPMEITQTAKTLLSKHEFMQVIEQEEALQPEDASNPEVKEDENPVVAEPAPEEQPAPEPKRSVVVDEPQEEAQSIEQTEEDAQNTSEIIEQEEEPQEEKPDYASMLVKDLKVIMEERGVDCKGWLKKDIVEYLETH